MCTVTFIPSGNKIFLTSNRDERLRRKQALPPRFYIHNDVQLLYPRDEDAGGSWIAVNENGNTAVLLNGAFNKHAPFSAYRKSRGLILLDIIRANLPATYFSKIDLSGIEPFTVIIVEAGNLFECRWNGIRKFCKRLEITHAYIWSSATLYDNEVKRKREQWFSDWLAENKSPTQNSILSFHRFAGDGNNSTDLVMNREGQVDTVSITSIELDNENANIQYLDIKNKEAHYAKMQFIHTATTHYEHHAY